MFQINERVQHFETTWNETGDCQNTMSYPVEIVVIVVCCLIGMVWAVFNIWKVEKIDVCRGFIGSNEETSLKSPLSSA